MQASSRPSHQPVTPALREWIIQQAALFILIGLTGHDRVAVVHAGQADQADVPQQSGPSSARRSSRTQSLMRISPRVAAASAMNDPISMWSGQTSSC